MVDETSNGWNACAATPGQFRRSELVKHHPKVTASALESRTSLGVVHPSASGSLSEGLDGILTVLRLDLPERLETGAVVDQLERGPAQPGA